MGVDPNKCTVSLAAVNARGERIDRLTVSTQCVDRMEEWLKKPPGPVHLAVETQGEP